MVSPGNLYSLGHLSPRPDPAIFWDFSWDEMAERDLPAMLAHMMQVGLEARVWVTVRVRVL